MNVGILMTVNLLLLSVANGAIAGGLPLQVGAYRLGTSNYIQIAQQGDRLCYQGFSNRGSSVGSIAPDPTLQNFSRIHGFDDAVLHQPDLETLLFGPRHQLTKYTADYSVSRTISPTLQQCLDAKDPFSKLEQGRQGR
jgi:hypothetical protein